MRRLMADIMGTYLERRNSPYRLPSVPSVLRAALAYIPPGLNPDDTIGQDTVKALAKCKSRPEWGDESHIALFAARVVHSAEHDFSPIAGSSRVMVWFPARSHHKLALAVVVMYFLYPKLTRQPLSRDALGYLSGNFRCIECGRDLPEDSGNVRPPPPAACAVLSDARGRRDIRVRTPEGAPFMEGGVAVEDRPSRRRPPRRPGEERPGRVVRIFNLRCRMTCRAPGCFKPHVRTTVMHGDFRT
ncbi:hypothetical protein DL768_011451 [Monosporascus sp. mg162]|nr:hypothetical protein DL768_011451 [Monosporascus sp. mg162]